LWQISAPRNRTPSSLAISESSHQVKEEEEEEEGDEDEHDEEDDE